MSTKEIKTRVQHKHGTAEDWSKSSLVPLLGELIIYDKDSTHPYERFKIGDGVTNVNNLKFVAGSDLKAGANITITSNATDGSLSIAATNTDTKVTSAANHYTPTADTNAALVADASSTTAATWNSTNLVTGVNIQRDAKGHVTGLTLDSIKIPANPVSFSSVKNALGMGTGNFTANRLLYTNSATAIGQGHYVSASKLAINSTTAPSETFYVNGTGKIAGTLSIVSQLSVGPQDNNHEGGEVLLRAPTTAINSIQIDNYDGQFRIFGAPSEDGNIAGPGTPLCVNPYAKAITGGYSFDGNAATATTLTNTLPLTKGGTGATNPVTAANNLGVELLTGGVEIPANSNLNDYKTPGNYFSASAAISQTLSNSPIIDLGFSLKIKYIYGFSSGAKTGLVTQEVMDYMGVKYHRSLNSENTWSSWQKDTADFSTSYNSSAAMVDNRTYLVSVNSTNYPGGLKINTTNTGGMYGTHFILNFTSTVSVTITGATKIYDPDDITSAASGETWEISAMAGYVVVKKTS